MDYWDIGYDSAKSRYGIPAREHPDYKDRAKRLAEITKALRAMADEVIYPRYMAVGEQVAAGGYKRFDPEYEAAYAELRAWHDAMAAPLLRERGAILRTVDADLYRTDGGTLSVRYDRVGKYAWQREFKRLAEAGLR